MRSFGRPATGRAFQDFNELTQGAKTYEGFITLHEKDQHLYAEIKPQLLEQPILAPMVIARGLGQRRAAAEFRRRVGADVPPGRR